MKHAKINIAISLSLGLAHLPAFAQFGATLELGSLDGTNGFRINGEAVDDNSGFSVSTAGDVNGDGIDDLIIGARRADSGGNSDAGSSYVVFGSADGFPNPFDLATLDGANGFKINGEATFDRSGNSVSAAGDVNGDGLGDLIIGAYGADPNGNSYAGSSYVVFGSADPRPAVLELGALDGTNGFRIDGEVAYDYSGYSVSNAGDVNGDGFDDVLIGSKGANGYGSAYLVFGGSGPQTSVIQLSSLDGTNGVRIDGEAVGNLSGRAVSAAGDVNGDGIDDLMTSAIGEEPNGNIDSGRSYVVYGSTKGLPNPVNMGASNGANGLTLNGELPYDYSGFSISTAGDFNGDGIDDFIIGAYGADPDGKSKAGRSYVIFGSNSLPALPTNLSGLNGTNGFKLSGESVNDYSGYSVNTAGDINDDGFDDLIIGAWRAAPDGLSQAGRSYVVFGTDITPPAEIQLSTLNGNNGFKLDGVSLFDFSGRSVGTAGDVNGDGIDDLIIGAWGADPNGNSQAGSSYVVFGIEGPIFEDGFE